MTRKQAEKLLIACKLFLEGWGHFRQHIDSIKPHLDADSIRFMNEVPDKIYTAYSEADSFKEQI